MASGVAGTVANGFHHDVLGIEIMAKLHSAEHQKHEKRRDHRHVGGGGARPIT